MLKPLGDRILVKPDLPAPLTSESGIEIVEVTQPPAVMGTVVEIGDTRCPACKALKPFPVTKGATVIFTPSAGEEVSIDGDNYIMLRAGDIIAVAVED